MKIIHLLVIKLFVMVSTCLTLIAFLTFSWHSAIPLPTFLEVNQIFKEVPKDLSQETLLVPRYDLLDIDEGPEGAPPDFIMKVNRAAKKGNTTISDILEKNYSFQYELVSLEDIPQKKEEGYKYFVDMVLMPKQMKEVEPRAMVPSWEKYGTANKMFRNRNGQFHYYFYIRDLRTNDAYVTTRLKGGWEVYECMKKFFRQVNKDATENQ